MDVRSLLIIVAALFLLWLLRSWLRRNIPTRSNDSERIKRKLREPPQPNRNDLFSEETADTEHGAEKNISSEKPKLAFEVPDQPTANAAHPIDEAIDEAQMQPAVKKKVTAWPSLHESSQSDSKYEEGLAADPKELKNATAEYQTAIRKKARDRLVAQVKQEKSASEPAPEVANFMLDTDTDTDTDTSTSKEQLATNEIDDPDFYENNKAVQLLDDEISSVASTEPAAAPATAITAAKEFAMTDEHLVESVDEDSADSQILQLQTKLDELEALIEARDQQLQTQKHAFKELGKLKQQLANRGRDDEEQKNADQQFEDPLDIFRRGAEKAAMLEQQLAEGTSSIIAVEERDATIKRLNESLKRAEADAAVAQQNDLELRRLRSELVNLEVKNTLSSNRVSEMERRIKEQQKALTEKLDKKSREDGLSFEGVGLSARDDEQSKKSAPANPVGLFVPSAEEDDLKLIKGIGPVMEGMLNELGINSFRQLSQLSREDIEQVSVALDAFPDRIERDDWLGQAANFQREKYGETL